MDTVGIVACSNAQKKTFAKKNNRLMEYLESIGRDVLISECIYGSTSEFSGTGKERAANLMKMFTNPDVTDIYDISGGDMANEVLDYLDFKKTKESSAVFHGYSDLTTVINAIYTKTGKSSVLYQIKNIVDEEYGEIQKRRYNNPYELFNVNFRMVQGESIKGIVVGGNIRCFLKLAGTEYFPDMTGKVLLIESLGGRVPQMVTFLSQLKSIGVFKKISGIIMGTFTTMEEEQCKPDMISLVKEFAGPNMPIAKTEEIGHGHDSKAIWIGKEIEIVKQ